MMSEAVGLVNTLQNWTVVDKIILSTKTPEKRTIFGKGNFRSLTGVEASVNFAECLRRSRCCLVVLMCDVPGRAITRRATNGPDVSVLLSERIRRLPQITAVFMNVERLSPLSEVSWCLANLPPTRPKYFPDGLIPEGSLLPSACVLSQRELEEAWGLKVFDRYSVVLHIFRCNARTKEAKLQISLAEIPLLR